MDSICRCITAKDYLGMCIEPREDEIIVVGVTESGSRDAGDAVCVARSRLAAAMPDTETRDGEPTAELRAAVEDHDPDVVPTGAQQTQRASDRRLQHSFRILTGRSSSCRCRTSSS
jgi:hypothetical protein